MVALHELDIRTNESFWSRIAKPDQLIFDRLSVIMSPRQEMKVSHSHTRLVSFSLKADFIFARANAATMCIT
jgi:hypothetical protein